MCAGARDVERPCMKVRLTPSLTTLNISVYHIDDYTDRRARPVKKILKNLRSTSSTDSDWYQAASMLDNQPKTHQTKKCDGKYLTSARGEH